MELGAEAWVAVTGVAEVISGDGVEAEMLTILRKGLTDDEAAQQWSGDGLDRRPRGHPDPADAVRLAAGLTARPSPSPVS